MKFYLMNDLIDFEISKEGVIRNKHTFKIKSQYVSDTGYYMISVSQNNKSKPYRVHRLLAQTFISNPHNKPEVNHKDGNKLNNSLGNLEWVTHLENMQHAFKSGIANNTGVKNGMSKLTPNKVKKIKLMLSRGISQYKIAKEIGDISRSAILKIHLGKTWANV